MKVSSLSIGDYVKPKSGLSFHLASDTWIFDKAHRDEDVPVAAFNVANLVYEYPGNHFINTADCALYLGRTKDKIKIVGKYISYNFLISGHIYKVSGYEIRHLEFAFKE
ncbi:hypothetical protein OAA09_00880 [bacterium]|nr:hypothetical protein [bacterium]